MGSDVWIQSILNGVVSASIYVLVAVGLALILSIMRILQFAHGEIYMFGAFITYYLCAGTGLDFLPALVISALLLGLLGIGIEKVLFRPFRADAISVIIIATALMLVLRTVGLIAFGGTDKVFTNLPFSGVITIGGATLATQRLMVIVVSVIFVLVLFFITNRTKLGQAMVAVSQDLDAAALLGINADRTSSFAMFLGCALAAGAGALMGALFGLSTSMGDFALMKGIAVIILGGLGSIPGAVIGGLILGLVDGIVPQVLSAHLTGLISVLVVILVLIFRPKGIMGHE